MRPFQAAWFIKAPGAGAAVAVDHDHEGDSDAAEDIEREQALDGRGSESGTWSLRLGAPKRLIAGSHLRYALRGAFAKCAVCNFAVAGGPFTAKLPPSGNLPQDRKQPLEASCADFQPFVSPDDNRPEFTLRAVLLGALFGIIFGGVTVYVGLRAGLTVAASIPIAVISISLLRTRGSRRCWRRSLCRPAATQASRLRRA